jgi:peptide/nickel transport system permease protein
MAGLIVITFFAIAFIYGYFYNAPATSLTTYCASEGLPPPGDCAAGYPVICTYSAGSASPGPGCYATPKGFSNFIPPTLSLGSLSAGPLPFGSLVSPTGGTEVDTNVLFNLYDGLVKGTDWSIGIALAVVVTGAMSGMFLGAISGYSGGVLDEAIMRVTDIFLSIPGLLLVIVIIVAGKETGITGFDNTVLLIVGAFTVTVWPLYTRIVRGQALIVREQKYVEAAKATGAGKGRIIRKHIVPNSMFPVFIQMSLDVGTVPLSLAGIAFLGFVIFPAPLIPEWGSIAAASTELLPSLFQQCQISGGSLCSIPWWQVLFPGLVLFLWAISVNFLADGFRDALDPRLRR